MHPSKDVSFIFGKRTIQELGLSKIYPERDNDTSKWLSHTMGLHILIHRR